MEEGSLSAPYISHSAFDMLLAEPRVKSISNDEPMVAAAFATNSRGVKELYVKVICGVNTNSMESFRLIVTEVMPTLSITLKYDQDVESETRYLWYIEARLGNVDQMEQLDFLIDSSDDYEDPKIGTKVVLK